MGLRLGDRRYVCHYLDKSYVAAGGKFQFMCCFYYFTTESNVGICRRGVVLTRVLAVATCDMACGKYRDSQLIGMMTRRALK